MKNKQLDVVLDEGLETILKSFDAYRRVITGNFPHGKTRLKVLEYRLKRRIRNILEEVNDDIWNIERGIELKASKIEYSKAKKKRHHRIAVDDFDLTNSRFEASA